MAEMESMGPKMPWKSCFKLDFLFLANPSLFWCFQVFDISILGFGKFGQFLFAYLIHFFASNDSDLRFLAGFDYQGLLSLSCYVRLALF